LTSSITVSNVKAYTVSNVKAYLWALVLSPVIALLALVLAVAAIAITIRMDDRISAIEESTSSISAAPATSAIVVAYGDDDSGVAGGACRGRVRQSWRVQYSIGDRGG